MKLNFLFLAMFISLFIASCDNDDDLTPKDGYEFVEVGIPTLMSKSEFRKTAEITSPEPINELGKIYAYKDYIFITDHERGIHVIDNSDPANPIKAKFIKLLANEDISVKNDYLYADSATDLVVFDISDIQSISIVDRLEDVFDTYGYVQVDALGFDDVDFGEINFEEDIVVGWTSVIEEREIVDFGPEIFVDVETTSDAAGGETGQGGSLARFKIVEDFLYTVSTYEMFIFDIQNLAAPNLVNTQYAGWNIETIFYADDYLYLGGTNGMYIYGINNPAAPQYVSEFTHWEGCDPVVVDGDYAYLTLRGGNDCGQMESVLEVIDINDKTNPTLVAQHILENPYGLGFKANTLYVCDGTAGLKLFDKTNPLNLELLKEYENIQSKDVIPLENSLLMIGGSTLYQYNYTDNGVELISEFHLN